MAEPNPTNTPLAGSLLGNWLNSITPEEIENLTGRKLGSKSKEDIFALAEQIVDLKGSPNASDRTEAGILLRQAQGQYGADDFETLQDHIANYTADFVKNNAVSGGGGSSQSAQVKALRSYLKSKAGLAALQTGAGLFQVIDAAVKAKNLQPPKFPEQLMKNANLQNEINTTKVRAEQGDPTLRQMFKDMLAEDQAVTDDRSRASGSVGQYAANIQAGASRRTDAMRQYEDQVAQRKLSDRDRLRQLIGMDISEDQAIQDGEWRRAFYENQNYQINTNRLGEQLGSGVENVFGGLDNMISPLSIFAASNSNAPAAKAAGDAIDLGAADGIYDSQPYMPETNNVPDLTLPEFQLLGSQDLRTPELIEKYKSSLRSQGLQVTDGFGEWGDLEQEIYDRNFNLNDSVKAIQRALM